MSFVNLMLNRQVQVHNYDVQHNIKEHKMKKKYNLQIIFVRFNAVQA